MTYTRKTLTALTLVAGFAHAQQSIAQGGLPYPGFDTDTSDIALLVTDPQNDFLHTDGVAWGVAGANVEANYRMTASLGADTDTVVAAMRNAD